MNILPIYVAYREINNLFALGVIGSTKKKKRFQNENVAQNMKKINK